MEARGITEKRARGFYAGMPKKGGRTKGTPNKVTGELRQMILDALSEKGGTEYLARQADENPTAFMSLLGKVLPMTLSGGDGTSGKLTIRWES